MRVTGNGSSLGGPFFVGARRNGRRCWPATRSRCNRQRFPRGASIVLWIFVFLAAGDELLELPSVSRGTVPALSDSTRVGSTDTLVSSQRYV